jgi:hypothetical protein
MSSGYVPSLYGMARSSSGGRPVMNDRFRGVALVVLCAGMLMIVLDGSMTVLTTL